jgi:tetratricopeptide (TPR) repeat protein
LSLYVTFYKNIEAYFNYVKGINLLKEKKYDEAIREFLQCIELVPHYKQVYYQKGLAHYYLGNYLIALKDFEKALQENPNDKIINLSIANSLAKLLEYEKSLLMYDLVISLDNKFFLAYYNKALCLFEMGRYFESIDTFSKSIELDKEYLPSYYSRGLAYCELSKFSDAINDFNVVVEKDPSYFQVYIDRGLAHYEMKDLIRAYKDFDIAVTINPNDPYPYFLRGSIHFEVEDYFRAINDFNKCITLNPDYTEAYLCRGYCFQKYEDLDNCLEDWKIAAKLGSKEAKDNLKKIFNIDIKTKK